MPSIKTKSIGGIFTLYFFWPILVFAAAAGVTPAPAPPAPAQIYIAQVQTTGGKNNTQEDFIELFNPNAAPVNLKGCRLVKRSAGASADTLIKSFSKDTLIPAKSFFLWANSAYGSINTAPDVTSSATVSDDNGVALRFGANGTIIDSVSWGKAGGEFNNVSQINPGAGQAITRKDLYTAVSGYAILPSQPHNSTVNDLAAAFEGSENPPLPTAQKTSAPAGAQAPLVPQPTAVATPTGGQVLVGQITEGDSQPAGQLADYGSQDYQTGSHSNGFNYLILAAGSLGALGFLSYQFFWKNRRNKNKI